MEYCVDDDDHGDVLYTAKANRENIVKNCQQESPYHILTYIEKRGGNTIDAKKGNA